jgi:hypothetical protein
MGVALGPSNTLAHHRTTTMQCGTAKGLMSALLSPKQMVPMTYDVKAP